MSRLLWLLMAVPVALTSCQKATDQPANPALDQRAIVETWRYPCGPSCDAAAWVLLLEDGTAYETTNLPDSYQTERQPVLVRFRKTGKVTNPQTGTGLEIVSILKISAR